MKNIAAIKNTHPIASNELEIKNALSISPPPKRSIKWCSNGVPSGVPCSDVYVNATERGREDGELQAVSVIVGYARVGEPHLIVVGESIIVHFSPLVP